MNYMFNLKYLNNEEEIAYKVDFNKISNNVVELKGDFPIQTDGFTLSRETHEDNWDYSTFTTVYREIENGCQFSNDGSVYAEPVISIPTDEELAEMEERERIANITNEINELKAQLDASDYKVIKCFECSMVGEEMSYDVNELHAERQIIRDMINEKEAEL